MFGENSVGRRVSLLNDAPTKQPPHQHPRHSISHRHQQQHHHHQRSISYTGAPMYRSHRKYCTSQASRSASSSPENLPSTPPLVRLNSISSSGTQSTPSPMTPTYPFDPLEHSKSSAPYYASHFQPNGSGYPAPHGQEPAAQPYFHLQNAPMPTTEMEDTYPSLSPAQLQPIQPQAQFSSNTDPSLTVTPSNSLLGSGVPPTTSPPKPSTSTSKPSSNGAATTPPSSKTIKKKYPCPHATRFHCADTFTTSGHAARHGKKHTGEKNIHCPTCNKAFTRKDNMKQHERTHRSSKNAEPTQKLDSPVTPATSVSKPTSSASSRQRGFAAGTSNSEESGDQPMPFDGDSSKLQLSNHHGLSDFMPDIRPTVNGRVPSIGGRSEVDGEGDSPGLDALAVASAIASDAR